MKKRILSMLLVIVMVLALVPVQALADGEQIEITGKANVAKDGTTSFFAKVSGAALNDVEWEAKDNTIANVEKVEGTNECKITGLTEGRTTIVAKKDGCTQGERNITVYIPQGAVTITGPDTVKAGEMVAAVGSTGISTGPHLHFEVRQDGQAQNPVVYFDSGIRETLKME